MRRIHQMRSLKENLIALLKAYYKCCIFIIGVRYTTAMIRIPILIIVFLISVMNSGYTLNLFQIITLLLLSFYTWYMWNILVFQRKLCKENNLTGYLRLDRIFEIHIGKKMTNSFQFNQSMIHIIEFCKRENLKIEFVTGLFSYGRMIRMLGDSILLIKPLGPISNLFLSEMTKTYEIETSFNSDHLHRVILDPHKIKVKVNSKGRKTISY